MHPENLVPSPAVLATEEGYRCRRKQACVSKEEYKTTHHTAAMASCLGTWVGGSAETRAQRSSLLSETGSLCLVPLPLTLIKCKLSITEHALHATHSRATDTHYLTDSRDTDSLSITFSPISQRPKRLRCF